MGRPIYLDYNATTPVDARVLETMLPFFSEVFGNASSQHAFGRAAKNAVERARARVAGLLGAGADEIVFTSGATEAINLAIAGVAAAQAKRGKHLVTQVTEHKAVLDACRALERQGYRVTYLPVDAYGVVDPAAVAAALTKETVLVSIMHVNNEIGTLQPIADIGAACARAGVLFHTDAVQSVGKVPFDVNAMHVDLASISAHKLYGPKGVGALYVRRRPRSVRLMPQLHGGGQEQGLRPGTLNVSGIVGLGQACLEASAVLATEPDELETLRRRLHAAIERQTPGVHLNGHPERRQPGNLHLSFDGVETRDLLTLLEDVAVSNGSACASGTTAASHVMRALGVSDERMHGCLRLCVGRMTSAADVDLAAERVSKTVAELRGRSAI